MAAMQTDRRGISLMEVLISIGILAIGLSSVVAIIPAARSQASRAVILDRAAALAANALADAATFGLLRPDSLTVVPTFATPVVVDPASATSPLTNTVSGSLRVAGIFATVNSASGTLPAAAAVHRLITESRDDIIVDGTASPDDPPLERFAVGVRAFEGRMSCLYCLRSGSLAGQPGRLSVVVFHGRDLSAPAVSGTVANFEVTIGSAPVVVTATTAAGVIYWEKQNGQVVNSGETLGKTWLRVFTPGGHPEGNLQLQQTLTATAPGRSILTIVTSGSVATGQTVGFLQPVVDGRLLRDIVKPGVVLWEPSERRFHQAVAAAPVASGSSAYLTLVPGSPIFSGSVPVPVQFLPDSVGLAERPFLPEATTPYTE